MKIMVSSLTYPLPNGVTASLNTAVDGLLKHGHEVMIVAPDYKMKKVRPEHHTVPSSLVLHMMAKNILGKEERVFRINSRKKIDELSKTFDPDIYWLHSVTWAANAFEQQMVKSKKKKVLFYHTLVEEYGRLYAGDMGAFIMRKRTESLGNKVDAIMTPSDMMKKRLIKCGVKKPIHIIPTGIDVPDKSFTKKEIKERFNIPDKMKVLLYLGRMSKEKNLDVLLDMVKELKEKNYNAILLFVGPGDIDEVNEDAKKMNISDRVICTGPLKREEAQRVYGACDAFVFSSQTETQGLVVGEAMLARTPVVALVSPIQKEVYPEGKAVVVKKEKDFAQAVIDILENKKERERMIKDAEKFVLQNFSKKSMIEKQIKVFKEVLRK
jgi:1,2-diacylglycerol 3-alpha-glucosyltransferase